MENNVVDSIGFEPVLDEHTQLVILGSFPGQASLQKQEYYAFARNQFWPIVGRLLNESDLMHFAYEQKLHFLLRHQVGLWDVYKACQRKGSLDSNITAGQPNDLKLLIQKAPRLKVIAHNGQASAKFIKETSALGVVALALPSTSPAHARMSLAEKLAIWAHAFALAGVLPESYVLPEKRL